MPVGTVLEESFFNYIYKPLFQLNYETNSQISVFKKNLRDIGFRIRGESREDFKENIKTNPELLLIMYSDMIKKVQNIEKDLFETRDDGVYYIHNNADLKIDKKRLPFSIYAYWIFEYCQTIKSIFSDHLEESSKLLQKEGSPIDHSLLTSIGKSPVKRKRREINKPSFELINEKANLNAVHKILEDQEIIQKIKFTDFERVFSGKEINHKVVWENANAARYFVNGIYKKSIKNALEGKWKRTVKCFKSPNRDFIPSDFKNTKDPSASATLHLDKTIRLMNKI